MADPAAAGRPTTPHDVLARLRTLPTTGHVTVALDAMGGDNAPGEVVEGAIGVAGEHLHVALVGRAELLEPLAAGCAYVSVVDARDVIGSGDEPARAVRSLPDSSLVVAAKLVAEGKAQAVVSAGNTGAVVAAALFNVRRMKGVLRPAICVLVPAAPLPVVFLDVGANAQVRTEHLRQFAIMGQIFAAEVLGIAEPTVGLLSIGEEPGKGTPAVIETHELLAADPAIRFYGNVEGRDLMNRRCDVVVTDGFTGNVALKTMEGTARAILSRLKEAVAGGSPLAKLGALLLRDDLRGLRAVLDPEEYGGSYLLGMNDPVVIAHGSSHARGIGNAVLMAARGATSGLLPAIGARLGGESAAAAVAAGEPADEA